MSARRLGLLWALGGAITGCIVGAALGLIIALVMYGRSAPAGQGAAFTGTGTLGFVGLIAAIALGLWAVLQLREAPLKYNGAMATPEMDFRARLGAPRPTVPASSSRGAWPEGSRDA